MANIFAGFLNPGGDSVLPMESGSNANGNWIKFADGTMIEWGQATMTTPGTSSTAGLITKAHYVAQQLITFPIAFVSNPSTSVNSDANSEYHFLFPETSSLNNMRARIVASTGNATFNVCWLAVGRWK